jgi:hypothetical protein
MGQPSEHQHQVIMGSFSGKGAAIGGGTGAAAGAAIGLAGGPIGALAGAGIGALAGTLQDAINGANQQYASELNNLNGNYGSLEKLQLGTINTLSKNIGSSPYEKLATTAANQALGQSGNLNSLGNVFSAYGTQALANSGPNALENSLMGQAQANLALGSGLSTEDQRAATQMANAQYAQNGFGNSAGAAATGILNRYNLGQQRLQQRQGAATAIDSSVNQNTLARSGQALGVLGQGANAYGQAATIGYQGSNALSALNPYTQALGYGSALSGQNFATQASLMNPAYAIQNENAFNVPSFNANMATANWNSQNQLAQANYASQMAMLGSVIGAGAKIGSAAFAPGAGA